MVVTYKAKVTLTDSLKYPHIAHLSHIGSRENGQKPIGTKAHLDKNPLDNITVVKSPLLNLTAHFLKNGLKSIMKLLTLIRLALLLQGKSHMQCVFTGIIISRVCCDKQLNLGAY